MPDPDTTTPATHSRRSSKVLSALIPSFPRVSRSSSQANLRHSASDNSLQATPGSTRTTAGAVSPDQSTFVASPDPENRRQEVTYPDEFLAAPSMPYATRMDRADSDFSSRRSSFMSADGATSRDRGDRGDRDRAKEKSRPISLSVNYVPAKFTKLHEPGNWGHRRRKVGGGRSAFSEDASRMGMMGLVDDDDGVEYKMSRAGVKRKGKKVLRWNRFKWFLFVANTLLMLYGLATLISAILVWLNVFYSSDVIRVGNKDELIVSTVAAGLCTLTALIGYSGIILNNRAFLAVYTLLLWVDLAFIAAPGYMTYKQRTFNLEGKLNQQWSRALGSAGRLRIQDSLACCGYYSPFIEATQSPLCYSRSNLPGCKSRYLQLERRVLDIWYITAFSIVPAQIGIIITALLCSNHITYRFGKGLTPKRYRLDMRSMGVILDDYANKIAAQYGDTVAQEALSRSVSRISTDQSVRPTPAELGGASGGSTRNSFAGVGSTSGLKPTLGVRAGEDSVSISTQSTGWNSQIPPKETATGSGAPLYHPKRDSVDSPPPSGVRLVSNTSSVASHAAGEGSQLNFGVPSPRLDGPEDDRYRDAEDDMERMGVSTGTGYAIDLGPEVSAGRQPAGDRSSVGWAQ